MKRICKDCGTEFELSESEIGFYKSKGYDLPKRCKSCRDMKNGKITSSAMGSRTTSNNSHSASGTGHGTVIGYSGASSSGNGSKNSKMIIAIIAAIVIVAVIGIVATVKSLNKGDGDKYVADTSIQNYVPDVVTDLTNTDLNNAGSEETADLQNVEDVDTDSQDDAEDDALADDTENADAGTDSEEGNTSSQNTTTVSDNTSTAAAETIPAETTPAETAPLETPAETAPTTVNYYFRNSSLLNQHYEKHGIEMGFDSAESYQAAASAVINNPAALYKTEAEDGDGVYYVEATNEFVILSTDGYIRTYFLPSGGKAYFDRQ